jgi:ABC-type antimicrobial peptide transport system permease subunit
MLPVVLGIIVGLGAAAGAARLLSTQLYEMSPNDPLVYGSVTGLLILTAITSVAIPARRAATVDPVIALREE